MRRFSYVAEYCPTDLSMKLMTPSVTNSSKSTVKRFFLYPFNKRDEQMLVYTRRKPLHCIINRCPNRINEQIHNQLNIKLCFDDDFVSAAHADEVDEDHDDEITINPARRVSYHIRFALAHVGFYFRKEAGVSLPKPMQCLHLQPYAILHPYQEAGK